jgi:hypothetical protein
MGFKDKTALKILPGPNPVCPQRGPYEASEGIHPVMGKEKNWGWARIEILQRKRVFPSKLDFDIIAQNLL